MLATLALACRRVVERATSLAITYTPRVCMLEMRASHDSPIAVLTQSPAHRAHVASCDLAIRVLHRARCGRVLPHARADCSPYVNLKCAVYSRSSLGSIWLLFRHSMHATLEIAVQTHCIHIGPGVWFPMCFANGRLCHRPTVARLRSSRNLRPTSTTANSTQAQR